MNRSVWDDDKCHDVWEHLVTDTPYLWPWRSNVVRKFGDLALASSEEIKSYSGNDLGSSRRLRSFVREILTGRDVQKADEIANWIVVEWGGIKGGKDAIPNWMENLRPFDSNSVMDFIRSQQTDRISSWSKILSFFDYERYVVYDSRTAVALNSALERCGLRPKFHMPASQNKTLNMAIPVIKEKYKVLSSGYFEYIHLLERFVEIGKISSILEAERAIFAGAEGTASKMLQEIGSKRDLA